MIILKHIILNVQSVANSVIDKIGQEWDNRVECQSNKIFGPNIWI